MPVYRMPNDSKRWYFTFYFEGKKIKKTKWNGEALTTKSQAMEAERQCLKQLERDFDKGGKDLTLYGLYDEFVSSTKTTLKEKTLRTYEVFKNMYLTLIDDVSIWKLTPKLISKWKNNVAAMDVSVTHKNRKLNIMKNVLNYGQIVYGIPGNIQIPILEPLKDNSVIVVEEKEKSLPAAEFERMVEQLHLEDEKQFYYYTVLNVLFYCGLRIGELAALTIDDYKDHAFYITKDYMRVNEKDIIQAPKNKNSVRKVYIDMTTENILQEYIMRMDPQKNERLFHLESEYLNQQKIRRVIKQLAAACGLLEKYDIYPHSLRHSHATHLRSLGYDEFTISKRLGNTPAVAAGTYIHSNDQEQKEIALKLKK